MPWRMRGLFLALLVLFALAWSSAAQPAAFTYGDTVSSKVDSTQPQAFYTFSGSAEDLVTMYVLGWTRELRPTLALLGPAGQIAFSSSDPFTPMLNDARITVRLPASGAYSILVGSASGEGAFTLTLQLEEAAIPLTLTGEPVQINVAPDGVPLAYRIAGGAGATTLLIEALTPGTGIQAMLRDARGQLVAVINGGLAPITLTLPPGEGPYDLLIGGVLPQLGGALTLQPVATEEAGAPAPAATEEASLPAGGCLAIAGANGVNVRRGPGTNYEVIAALRPGEALAVNGQFQGWYSGLFRNTSGWVSGSVSTLQGDCQGLPQVQPPPPPPASTEEASAPLPVSTEEVDDSGQGRGRGRGGDDGDDDDDDD